MEIDDITRVAVRYKAAQMADQLMDQTALSKFLYADLKKPSAWQAFKYRVVSRVKEAVRWATYWAWEDHLY